MKTRFLTSFLLSLLLLGITILAQTVPETIVSYTIETYSQGVDPSTGSPVQTNAFPASAWTCNLTSSSAPAGTVVNPSKLRIADPVNAGKDCEVALAQATTIFALPVGATFVNYAKANGATTTSARSAASNPFSHAIIPAPPAVPVQVRLLP